MIVCRGRSGLRAWRRSAGGVAGQPQDRDSEVSQGSHDLWGAGGADLGAVFVEVQVTNPVQLVFDHLVAPDDGGEPGGLAWAACGEASPAATAVTFMACAVMGTAGPVLFRAVELRIEGKKGVREPVGRFHRCVVPDAVEGNSSHVLGDLP